MSRYCFPVRASVEYSTPLALLVGTWCIFFWHVRVPQQDLFPAQPLRSSIVFHINVLKLLYQHLMFGIGRAHAWSRGLRAFLEAENPILLPDFYCMYVKLLSNNIHIIKNPQAPRCIP